MYLMALEVLALFKIKAKGGMVRLGAGLTPFFKKNIFIDAK